MSIKDNKYIYEQIQQERDYQVGRWGTEVDDTINTPWMWASYIGQYATNWMSGTFAPLDRAVTDKFRRSMIKVAALAIAAIESIDHQRNTNEKTFYEKEAA